MSFKPTKIYVHSSDSKFGDAALIDEWHKARGWSSPTGKHIGYHYVVLNGRRVTAKKYVKEHDGIIEAGRPETEQGAHVSGENWCSLGVCLIGDKEALFSVPQLRSVIFLLRELVKKHELSWSSIFGHYQAATGVAQGKTDPGFEIDVLRALVRGDN